MNYALEKINAIEDIVVYGQTDTGNCQRTGAISINVRGMHHGLTAAILNDYFNISVRNACFCAHPYVREMITDDLGSQMDELSNEELEALAELHRGMVRASFGIYNNHDDVDLLVVALKDIVTNREFYQHQYHQAPCDEFFHNSFKFESHTVFSTQTAVDKWMDS